MAADAHATGGEVPESKFSPVLSYEQVFARYRNREHYKGSFALFKDPQRNGSPLIACDMCESIHKFDMRQTSTMPLCMSPFRPGVLQDPNDMRDYCFQFGKSVRSFFLKPDWVHLLFEMDLTFTGGSITMCARASCRRYKMQLVQNVDVGDFFHWFNGGDCVGRPALPFVSVHVESHRCTSFASPDPILRRAFRATPKQQQLFEDRRFFPLREGWDSATTTMYDSDGDERPPPNPPVDWHVYPAHRLRELWSLVPRHLQVAYCRTLLAPMYAVTFQARSDPCWDPYGYQEECRSLKEGSYIELPGGDDDREEERGDDEEEEDVGEENEEEDAGEENEEEERSDGVRATIQTKP
jgi:hypothetical protein